MLLAHEECYVTCGNVWALVASLHNGKNNGTSSSDLEVDGNPPRGYSQPIHDSDSEKG